MAINERRRAANRENAKSSTGPKTPAGKAAVRRNAFKHGLSMSVVLEGPLPAQWERFAERLAGVRRDLLPLARAATKARFNMHRIDEANRLLLRQAMHSLETAEPGHRVEEYEARAVAVLAEVLMTRESYARRPRAEWKRLLKLLDQARLHPQGSPAARYIQRP